MMCEAILEDNELLADCRYRSYVSAVDKALKSFEYTSEWADLISALGKLNKVFNTYSKFQVIPRRTIISKRLAQCTHPALPSGVHLKALETYDIIFKCIGPGKLSQELFTFSAGLFPLLANASTSVKMCLLTLYENHFIPLGKHLQVGLTGFLLGILPGLEEGSDFHERTDVLLQKACESVGKEYFYGALWKCILTSPHIRHTAINFIIDHYNKKVFVEDQLYIFGTDIDMMVSAMCCSLEDHSVLVQRCTLDFLLLGLPIHNNQLVTSDMVRIVRAAVTVVLRRDLSLNRRLFSWLLGNESLSNSDSVFNKTKKSSKERCGQSYFQKHSMHILLDALRDCLKSSSSVELLGSSVSGSTDLWCYRVLISLLDCPEVNTELLDDILIEVFRSLYFKWSMQEISSLESGSGNINCCDIKKIANLLFASLEPCYLWAYLARLYENACRMEHDASFSIPAEGLKDERTNLVRPVGFGHPSTAELCCLMEFLLDIVPIEMDPQASVKYLPDLLSSTAGIVSIYCASLSPYSLLLIVDVFSKIVSKMKAPTCSENHAAQKCASVSVWKHPEASFCGGSFVDNASQHEESLCPSYRTYTHCPNSIDINQNRPTHSSNSIPGISNCLHKSKLLLVSFLKEKFLFNSDETLLRFESFLWNSPREKNYREKKLNKILERSSELKSVGVVCEIKDLINQYDGEMKSRMDNFFSHMFQEIISCCDTLQTVFVKLCGLIKELSFFPIGTCDNFEETSRENIAQVVIFPEWLKLLASVACFANVEKITFAATKTLLELISISLSACIQSSSSKQKLISPEQDNSLKTAIISPTELESIYENTFFFEASSVKLWNFMENTYSFVHLEAARLLHQIHNLSSDESVCEQVICNSLTSADEEVLVSALKKFSSLWHLTRHHSINLSSLSKSFDQCFFHMLDNLSKDGGPHKIVAQTWLNHCLQRGDTARIFEPLLLILLHSDSSRVSVQHIHVETMNVPENGVTVNFKGNETVGYAISSISGNDMYHISDNSQQSTTFMNSPKQFNVVSGTVHIKDRDQVLDTSQNLILNNFELSSSHENETIQVFVNPFGSLSSLCTNSVVMNGSDSSYLHVPHQSFFDDYDADSISLQSVSETVQKQNTCSNSEQVIAFIIDDILNNVTVLHKDGCKKPAEPEKSFEEFSYSVDGSFIHSSCSGIKYVEDKVVQNKHGSSEGIIHPLHTFILLYCQLFDSEKTIYALSSLKAVLQANSRLSLCSMATTNFSNSQSIRSQKLQNLLARHRQSVFGHAFHGEMNSETMSLYRCSTFLETVVLVCLYYVRSYYLNNPQIKLTYWEILGNRKIKFICVEILILIFSELSSVVKDCGRNFASYLNDLLLRCKVQKTFLHCLNASVHDCLSNVMGNERLTFTETVIEFNEKQRSPDWSQNEATDDFQTTFQVNLLKLMETLVVLEDTILTKTGFEKEQCSSIPRFSDTSFDVFGTEDVHGLTAVKYQQGMLIAAQPMLLKSVLVALRNAKHWCIHEHWITFIASILPYCGCVLPRFATSVAMQLCCNLDSIISLMRESERCIEIGISQKRLSLPPEYFLVVIEGLTTICHYCLLDYFPPVPNLHASILPPISTQSFASGMSASQIISNLFHVFSSSSHEKDPSGSREHVLSGGYMQIARRQILSNFPRIISSLSSVYQVVSITETDADNRAWQIVGLPKIVKQHVLNFLSPLSLNYNTNLIAAVSVVWYEKKQEDFLGKVIHPWSPEQMHLVALVLAIKVLPIESLAHTVRNILKQPPSISEMTKVPIEVSTLQFFLACMQKCTGVQLVESWQAFSSLLRDGLQYTSPSGQFHLLAILHDFVLRAPIFEDRKSRKDLQDIAHKLIDACSIVAGANLEQSAWLWRNVAVRPVCDADLSGQFVNDKGYAEGFSGESIVNNNSEEKYNAQYCVQSLTALAEFLAPVLDFIYIGEEKEKVVPLLSNIMYYVTPYLKNHSSYNIPSYTACCKLLSNISGYQHTRKAWRKDVFELLMDVHFFEMPGTCIIYWKAIIDHLMTYDKTTFRDFMARLSVAQSGSLNLFSSKDQEYEQRAHLLKRLSFIIFCSELDQYGKFMPDIQERLTESLKLPHVPIISTQVFLCFRVLLIRMSPQHITCLWPIIFSEMVQVFMHMGQELCEEERSSVDSSWVANCSETNSSSDPSWLPLYLNVCKLLDTAISLPPSILPQFQMYRWAFIGDSSLLNSESEFIFDSDEKMQQFIPYTNRLSILLNKKVNSDWKPLDIQVKPMLTMQAIQNIQELLTFFNAVSRFTMKDSETQLSSEKNQNETDVIQMPNDKSPSLMSVTASMVREVEKILDADFLEK